MYYFLVYQNEAYSKLAESSGQLVALRAGLRSVGPPKYPLRSKGLW